MIKNIIIYDINNIISYKHKKLINFYSDLPKSKTKSGKKKKLTPRRKK